jgi:putative inorganic carbon (HCO3(-)) transporter
MKVKQRPEQEIIEPLRPRGVGRGSSVESDYEGVKPSQGRPRDAVSKATVTTEIARSPRSSTSNVRVFPSTTKQQDAVIPTRPPKGKWLLKRGHAFSYLALFTFTLILYARPSEFYPSEITASIALVVGIITLVFFIPTQLAVEGTLTAPLMEVKLVLLFSLLGLLSVLLALDPALAWKDFSGTFIRCIVIFIVMVNVVRTEARLKGLLFLALAAAMWLSVGAVNDYRLGRLTVEGYRVDGRGTGIFGNTIDMALYLVTMLPIAIAFMFASRSKVLRIVFGGCAAVMLAAIVFTYSRGAFIGLVVIFVFMAMKFGPRNRLAITVGILLIVIGFLFFAPENYGVRLLSIFFPSLDPVGSATARRGELFRSIYIALRHPIFGVGMDNYRTQMSLRGLVTHNSYTQVASEMGLAALTCYVLFIVIPLRKLGQIVRETFAVAGDSRFYYMAVGLQASLIAYLVSSFFLSVPYLWYVYYLVGYAVCLRRIYESETGKPVVVVKRKEQQRDDLPSSGFTNNSERVPA